MNVNESTTAVVLGLHVKMIQNMLDYDFVCARTPSVTAIVNPDASSDSFQKFFFGKNEILLPIYKSIEKACSKHSNSEVAFNLSSHRSALKTSMQFLQQKSIQCVTIFAEGVPMSHAVELRTLAKSLDKTVIGPASIGFIKTGVLRIGSACGTMENIFQSKLQKQGSVGIVTKSGGLLNELCRIVSENSDGVNEAVAIGGDRFPCTGFLGTIKRFQEDPSIKLIVLLGELGGGNELKVAEALKQKKITKPLIAHITGKSAKLFPQGIQFGHAGAKSGSDNETAEFKSNALKKAGAIAVDSFKDLPSVIKKEFQKIEKVKK